jgi:acetyl/propionyl-CoA carboxylase alpha subunit
VAEKYLIRDGEGDVAFELEERDGTAFVRRESSDAWRAVRLERVGDSGLYLLMVDDHPVELYLERRRGGAIVTIGRHAFNYDVGLWRPGGPARNKEAGASGLIRITAPMTGSIVEVRCAPGDAVSAGDVLLVIESMKMNNELRSPAAGTVDSTPVSPGQRVKAGDLLVAVATARD